jgi:small subunit ribosomal protein S18
MNCPLCQRNIQKIDFKDKKFLSIFLFPNGKIKPRAKTGLCASHQRKIKKAIKRARFLAILPYTNLED